MSLPGIVCPGGWSAFRATTLLADLALWPEGNRLVPHAAVSRSKGELWTGIWQQPFPQESTRQFHFQGFFNARVSVEGTSVLGAVAAPAGALNSVLPSSGVAQTADYCSPT